MTEAQSRFRPQVKLAANGKFAEFVRGGSIYPINIEVSLTHVCQAKCDWCFYAGTHQKLGPESVMEERLALRLLQEMRALGVEAVTWTGGGEPTLHPRFKELVELAQCSGLKQGLFTNGRSHPKYDPALLDWVRVSNTERDWNVEVLKELRQRAGVLGMALNYNGEDAAVFRALEVGDLIGVDYVQVRQALNLRGLVTERKPPSIEHRLLMVTDYKFEDSNLAHGYSDCYGYHFVPFIWHDGDVDVCGYHRTGGLLEGGMPLTPERREELQAKRAIYNLGNLKQEALRRILDRAPRSVPVCGSCQVCCKNHEVNKMVNAAVGAVDRSFV